MGANTKISWTDNTFNMWTGCTEVSPGCDNCYARDLAQFHGWASWGSGTPRHFFKSTTKALLGWNRQAKKTEKRPKVFCSALGDFLDNEVDQEHREHLWELIEECDGLEWQLLTKRITNAKRMLPARWMQHGLPDHVWLGITVVNQDEADRDIAKLTEIPARIRWLSIEPCLGPMLLRKEWPIDWVIVGGESGAKRREMELTWLESIIAQCRAKNIAVWVKQDSARLPGMQGRIPDSWWIHEFPKAARS